MMIEFKTVLKNGKEVVLQPPQISDALEMMNYINELVEENVPILLNEKQTIEQEAAYLESTIKEIGNKNKVQLLAFIDGKLAGNAQIEKERWKASHVGEFGISIRNEFRGLGLGKILAAEIIKLAKQELGISLVKLDVFGGNEVAMGLYKKLGFTECGRVPDAVMQQGKLTERIMMCLKI
jgi:RimJ/RimL family protein N-acetyltransferase